MARFWGSIFGVGIFVSSMSADLITPLATPQFKVSRHWTMESICPCIFIEIGRAEQLSPTRSSAVGDRVLISSICTPVRAAISKGYIRN
jgi:hypothetical protein